MTNNEHDGMKKCSKCGEWKPATAEFFNRDDAKKCGLRSWCKECVREYRKENKDKILERKREYYEKNKEKHAEWQREYYEKNKEKLAEQKREYYEKNKDKIAEYREKNKRKISERERRYWLSPAGRFSESIKYLRRKTGATIYVRDMTEEQKETLASQRIAVQTLEKTEKDLLAASGKKRCSACDRILDYGCFSKDITKNDGVRAQCRSCIAKRDREYYQQNKNYYRDYYQRKKAIDKKNLYPIIGCNG